MPSTTAYKRWDVVLVPFPYSDFTATKRRPALIVSPDSYNFGPDVTIAFVTSQVNSPSRIGDYRLIQWQAAGLPKPSMVRMKFVTVDKAIVMRKLGSLREEDRVAIGKALLSFFAS